MKIKHIYKNSDTDLEILNRIICCSSMGKILTRRHIGTISKQIMPSYHIMPQANICKGRVFVRNHASRHQEKCMYKNGKNLTDGTRHSLHVWPYLSWRPLEVQKGLPDKCETIVILYKSYTIQ